MPAIVTNGGIAGYQAALNAGPQPVHVGWGTSDATLAPTNTDLDDPSGARVSGTPTIETENVTNDTYQVVATLTATGSVGIEEVGLFEGAGSGGPPPTGGTLYARGTFTTINLEEDDAINFTIRMILEQPD